MSLDNAFALIDVRCRLPSTDRRPVL